MKLDNDLFELTLTHYSPYESVALISIPQIKAKSKPTGLWVSVDGEFDWPTWCEQEEFGDIYKQNRFVVTLSQSAKILYLRTIDGILAFSEKYLSKESHVNAIITSDIDWPRISTSYHGILISPYQWKLRLDRRVNWYYGWDCASGCIWNKDAIKSIEIDNPVTEPTKSLVRRQMKF